MAVEVRFSHPDNRIGNLHVHVKPDQISWAYGLNTADFPTYGGEVVQILSAYIDDMTVSGTVRTYHSLERIYEYFIKYMQFATQGVGNTAGSYKIQPIQFEYMHRGWTFDIIPKGLPSFKYGRDVVAPTWTLQAAVSQADADFMDQVVSDKEFAHLASQGDFSPFGSVTGDIGFKIDNPFSGVIGAQAKNIPGETKKLTDFYTKLVENYGNNDFENLTADFSRPAFLAGDAGPEKATPGGKQTSTGSAGGK